MQVNCILLSKGLYFTHADLVRFSQKRQYASFRNTILSVLCRDTVSAYLQNHMMSYVSQNIIQVFILVISQLDSQNLFFNKFISCLYMFRAPCAHRQEVKIVLHGLWYHHTYRWPYLCTGRPQIGILIPEAV